MKMMPPSIQNPKFILPLVLRKTALQVVPPMSHHHAKKKQSSFRFHATKDLFLFSSQKIWNLPYCFPHYNHLSPYTSVTDKCHVGSTCLAKWTYHVVPHFFRMDNIANRRTTFGEDRKLLPRPNANSLTYLYHLLIVDVTQHI